MKLRFFLFDSSVPDFQQCIGKYDADLKNKEHVDDLNANEEQLLKEDASIESSKEASYRQLRLSNTISDLGIEVQAWVLEKSNNPVWLSFIAEYIAAEDPSRKGKTSEDIYGMLVLLKLQPENRIFGVSFGYGYRLVRYEKLESGFGRRVVLNVSPPNGLRTLDVHNIDLVTRQKRIRVNKKSDILDFRLDGEDVIVTGVIGIPSAEYEIGRSQLEGTDSLLISLNDKLPTIKSTCRKLFELYNLDQYTKTFPELTRLLPITGSKRHKLNEKLAKALDSRSIDNISLMVPSLDYAYGSSSFSIFHANNFIASIEEFEIEAFYKTLSQQQPYDWNSLTIGICREGQQKPSFRFSLLEGLIYLHEEGGESFLYSLGHWHKITQSYVERLTQKISEFATFDLPPMQPQQSEGDYNNTIAEYDEYCLLDKKLIQIDGRSRIEVADFVTNSWEFVCVKKSSSNGNTVRSSTLSHLFAQGSVSAILLAHDSNYRSKVAHYIQENKIDWQIPFNAKEIKEGHITFVYAIATTDNEPLANRLPLFSKITLVNHTEEIRKLGYQVKLCKIHQVKK